MSSLLQFNGKVGLVYYLVDETDVDMGDYTWKREVDREPSDELGRTLPKLYRIWRKPAGMFGCWVLFRYLGEEHAPDLSVPLRLREHPRGSEELSLEEARSYWFSG